MAFSHRSHEQMKTLSATGYRHTYPVLLFGALIRTFWQSAFVIPAAFRWRLTSSSPFKLPRPWSSVRLQPTWFALGLAEALIEIHMTVILPQERPSNESFYRSQSIVRLFDVIATRKVSRCRAWSAKRAVLHW